MKKNELMEILPPPDPRKAFLNNWLTQVEKHLTGEVMGKGMAHLAKAVEEGDRTALKDAHEIYKDYRQATAPEVRKEPAVTVNNVTNNTQINFLSDIRRNIVLLLEEEGSLTAKAISACLHAPIQQTLEALDHPWFERKARQRWLPTKEALVEVGGEAGKETA